MKTNFTIENIFYTDSINIFCDASIHTNNGCVSSSSGFITVYNNKIINQDFKIIKDSTNNIGELYGVLMSVKEATKYNKHVRIFCDSQLSIFAVRNRIFSWILKSDENGLLYGYDNKPIKNLSYILEIIYTILNSNIDIEFFHQKGHVQSNNPSLQNARDVFIRSNYEYIDQQVDSEFIELISNYNNYIDNFSRDMLLKHENEISGSIRPISFIYRDSLFNEDLYMNKINKERMNKN